MKNLILFYLLIIFSFSNCETPDPYRDSIIEMNKTPCFGACPDYDIIITGDGKAIFEGRQHAIRKGNHELKLNSVETTKIFEAFANSNFWAFEDEYTSNISDLPTTFISFSHDGQEKKIKDYYGSPQELKDLEDMVEKIVKMEGWKATEEQN